MTDITGRIAEVADGIYQVATYVPEPNLIFNQYLITGDEPMIFHTGPQALFPVVSKAIAEVTPVDSIKWIAFGHYEADECGSMNMWLDAAPESTVRQGMTGVMVSLTDQCVRPPVPWDAAGHDIGGHVIRWIDTPHVPHAWEAGVVYDETTKTLLCGDLFTQCGVHDASTEVDPMEITIASEDLYHYSSLAPHSGNTVRKLADLDITTLAVMHGPAYTGDCKAALLALADDYDRRIAAAS
jgi:flavorubredoxin